MTKALSRGFALVIILASVVMIGCKDDSGSSYVKPNEAQSNRYKQGGHGAPPGAANPGGGATSSTPQ